MIFRYYGSRAEWIEPRRVPGLDRIAWISDLQRTDFGRLGAFAPLAGLEFDPLAFFQRPESCDINVRLMDEDIIAAAFRSDEAKPFLIIKPFYCTCCHVTLLCSGSSTEPPLTCRPLSSRGKRTCLYCYVKNHAVKPCHCFFVLNEPPSSFRRFFRYVRPILQDPAPFSHPRRKVNPKPRPARSSGRHTRVQNDSFGYSFDGIAYSISARLTLLWCHIVCYMLKTLVFSRTTAREFVIWPNSLD